MDEEDLSSLEGWVAGPGTFLLILVRYCMTGGEGGLASVLSLSCRNVGYRFEGSCGSGYAAGNMQMRQWAFEVK